MNNKIIDVYTVCWNEEIRLPYFLKLWSPIARTITIFDNGSTDSSESIAKSFPNVVWNTTDYRRSTKHHEPYLTDIKNNGWKYSRDADLVFMGDIDEILFYKNQKIGDLLLKLDEGYTVFQPHGYNMVSSSVPTHDGQIYSNHDFQLGVRDDRYSKMCLFSPKHIQEINYTHGCHVCEPQGVVKIYRSDQFKLLHYHYLGYSFFDHRMKLMAERATDFARGKDGGFVIKRYTFDSTQRRKIYEDFLQQRFNVLD